MAEGAKVAADNHTDCRPQAAEEITAFAFPLTLSRVPGMMLAPLVLQSVFAFRLMAFAVSWSVTSGRQAKKELVAIQNDLG